MSAGYSDDVFQGELRKLEVRREGAVDETKTALKDLAALLQNSALSGLTFEPIFGNPGDQAAEAPWSGSSAEALLRSVGDSDIEPVRKITQLCEDLISRLEEALRTTTAELDRVDTALTLEDQRIAQIPSATNAASSSPPYAACGGVEVMRDKLDRVDHVEGDLAEAVTRLKGRDADIRAYLLIDSAMEAAQQISRATPLQDRDRVARAELKLLRLAMESLEVALKKVDATLMGAGDASRSLEK
jgi:hypothetical protein